MGRSSPMSSSPNNFPRLPLGLPPWRPWWQKITRQVGALFKSGRIAVSLAWNRLVAMDKDVHALIAARFPRALAAGDTVLGWLLPVVTDNKFGLIVGLVFVVLGVTGVIP